MNRLGVIPAAGKASRWGGVWKELLPCSRNETFIDRVIRSLMIGGECERVLVVTNYEKMFTHIMRLKHYHNITFAKQEGERDAWSAIMTSFPYSEDLNLYAMPDTFYPVNAFNRDYKSDFTMGYFRTRNARRFGIICEDDNPYIVDKPNMKGEQFAWGLVIWSKRVVEFWQDNVLDIETHTQAFNMAIDKFGLDMFEIPYYSDMATFDDYKEFISGL